MSDLTLRNVKGSPLTNQEVDDNFSNLNADKYQSGDSPTFTDVTADSLQITGGTGTQGTITWNDIDGTLDLDLGTATLQVGQEEHFYAKATEAIANGDVVMFAGAQGDHVLIAKANHSAVGFKPEYIMGVATQAFANNAFGYVTTFGKVRGLNTSTLDEGDILYSDPSNPGALTTTRPSPPDHIIQVAAVLSSNPAEGVILVRLTHFLDTDEVEEGSTNLYFTDARAVSAIQGDASWNASNWDTAYSWGNHASAGYLTGYTESDPTVPSHVKSITTTEKANWNTAYGWGNHASVGYLTSASLAGYATQTYVNTAVSNLVDSAPATLDTLNELAAALGDDPNFATTVSTSIGTKWTQDNTKISNWDTAYSWGDHASAGYLQDKGSASSIDLSTLTSGVDQGWYSWGSNISTNDAPFTYGVAITIRDDNQNIQLAIGSTSGRLAVRRANSGNYTAWNEFWSSGNDGSGSGLDADLLDGYQAAQGGASVAVVTTSSGYIAHDNWIRVGNGTGLYNAGGGYLYEESASVWAVRSRDSGSASLKLQTVNGTSRGRLYADSSSNQGFLNTGGSWRLTVPNSGNILRENAYTIWDSGNDGSGSGLDADSLDGYQYTAFNSSVLSYRTGGSATRYKIRLPFATNSSKMLKFTVSMYQSYAQHDYEVSGYLYPSTNQWYLPHVVYKGTGTPDIVVGRDGDGRAYVSVAGGSYTGVRVHSVVIGYTGSTADSYNQDWSIASDTDVSNSVTPVISRLWSSNNDGSGSGLDADTLDGIQAASFLRKDISDTFNGTLTVGGTSVSGGEGGEIRLTHAPTTTLNGSSVVIDMQTNSLRIFEDASPHRGAYIDLTTCNSQSKIWHDGNDGSGSGLDADLLDGQHGSYYYSSANMPPGTSSTGTWTTHTTAYGNIQLGPANSSYAHIYSSGPDFYFNKQILVLGNKVWNVGNDGSGSGLDADTLDGLQPSVSASNNTIVQRHSSGYIFANFFNTTPNDVSSGVTKVCVETGNDGYIRHGTPDAVALFLDGVSGGSISYATNGGGVNYVYVDSTVTYTPTRGSCGNHVYQCWGGALTLNLSDASWQKGDVVVVSNVKGDTSITVNATAIYLPNNTSDTQVTWNSKVGSFRLCKYNDATGYWMVLP